MWILKVPWFSFFFADLPLQITFISKLIQMVRFIWHLFFCPFLFNRCNFVTKLLRFMGKETIYSNQLHIFCSVSLFDFTKSNKSKAILFVKCISNCEIFLKSRCGKGFSKVVILLITLFTWNAYVYCFSSSSKNYLI